MSRAHRRCCWAPAAGPLGLASLMLLLVLSTAASAMAAVTVPTRSGWTKAGPGAAQVRAQAWAADAGGRAIAIMTTREVDDYAEILTVVELPGALPSAALGTDANADGPRTAALQSDAEALFGADGPPQAVARIDLGGPGLAAVHARWTIDDEVFLLALAPTGPTHAAVLMVLESTARVLYEPDFEALLLELDGVVATVEPFPRQTWRIAAMLVWILVAIAATVLVTRFGLQLRPAAVATRAALILAGTALAVGVATWLALADHTAPLALAGVSPAWMALEVAGPALGLAVLIVIVGGIVDRRRVPVSSAPTGGSFAPRGASPTPYDSPLGGMSVEARPTPIVGQPILPPRPPPAPAPAPLTAISGNTVVGPPPRHPTAELPANLEPATPLAPDRTLLWRPAGREPGTPRTLGGDPDRSERASLETEQILIDRGRSEGGVGRRRTIDDEG